MIVEKIARFSQEEIDTLTKAGTILGTLAKAVHASEVDGFDIEATNLVDALKEVLGRI